MLLDVGAVLFPTAKVVQLKEPEPVSMAEILLPARLFNVKAPESVKELLIDNVEPEAENVKEAALVVPFSVAVPPVFEIVIAPPVENTPML